VDRLLFRRVQMGVGGEEILEWGEGGGNGGMRGGLVT
jgi:hypothetical protein